MSHPRLRRRTAAALLGISAVLAGASPVGADPQDPADPSGAEGEVTFRSCPFRVNVQFSDGNMVTRTANGTLLTAGAGTALVFTNLRTGETFRTESSGAVTRITPNGDGTSTVEATGNFVILLFPKDDPAGPSTTLYNGRVTYLVDAKGHYTILSTSGTSTDVCAELA